MGQHIISGNPPVTVIVRKSAQARRMTLRVSRLDGRITLTMPEGVPEAQGVAFAKEKEGWLRKQIANHVTVSKVDFGTSLPVEGRLRVIRPCEGRRVILEDDALLVPGHRDQVPVKLRTFLKETARRRLVEAAHRYAGRLDRAYSSIVLRDTRSRWGSCTAEGRLMFSWRLILAPKDVLDYVAAHEVAHLAHMDHSPAFWRAVERIYGPYQDQRDWLRTDGNQLHAYRFED